jgi:hypothetical protein
VEAERGGFIGPVVLVRGRRGGFPVPRMELERHVVSGEARKAMEPQCGRASVQWACKRTASSASACEPASTVFSAHR